MKRAPDAKATPTFEAIQANPIVKKVGFDDAQVVLAFDLSQSCVGWAVGYNRQLERYGKLTFKSTAESGAKLAAFAELVNLLLFVFHPDVVLTETPMSGRAKVTARHYELFGILKSLVYARLGKEIDKSHGIYPVTVKKWMGIPKGMGKDHDHNKEIMIHIINDTFGLNLKYNAHSKSETDDDIADAIAVLETWYRREGIE